MSRFHRARVAVTTEGAVVINVARLDSPSATALVARALEDQAELFVGIVITGAERDELLKRVDDLAGDVVGDVPAQDEPGRGS